MSAIDRETNPEQGSRTSRAAEVVAGVIRGYQRFVSPLLGPRCRFHPSCSAYAEQAIRRYGVGRGTWLAARRVARCHPFCDGGFDPVPERYHWWGRDQDSS